MANGPNWPTEMTSNPPLGLWLIVEAECHGVVAADNEERGCPNGAESRSGLVP